MYYLTYDKKHIVDVRLMLFTNGHFPVWSYRNVWTDKEINPAEIDVQTATSYEFGKLEEVRRKHNRRRN